MRLLYIELGSLMRKVNTDFNKTLFGAYSIVGRLDDIPLNVTQVMPEHPMDPSLSKLQALGPGSGTIGAYFGDPGEHGGLAKPITAEQRAAWAKEGVAMIEAAVKAADVKGIAQGMRDHRNSASRSRIVSVEIFSQHNHAQGDCRQRHAGHFGRFVRTKHHGTGVMPASCQWLTAEFFQASQTIERNRTLLFSTNTTSLADFLTGGSVRNHFAMPMRSPIRMKSQRPGCYDQVHGN